MKDGMKTGITERRGGVWKSEGFPMKGSGIRFADSDDRGVHPKMKALHVPQRYIPKNLTQKDRKKQIAMLRKSRKLYKQHKYFTRKKVASFKSKPSHHIAKAMALYKVDKITPSVELAKATGCSVSAIKKIVKKGEGAYYSSGSRPNQTAHSWAYARLASAITAGNASRVDYDILEKGCGKNSKALKLAIK